MRARPLNPAPRDHAAYLGRRDQPAPQGQDGAAGEDGDDAEAVGRCPSFGAPQRVTVVNDVEYGFKFESQDYPPLHVSTTTATLCP